MIDPVASEGARMGRSPRVVFLREVDAAVMPGAPIRIEAAG